MPSESTASAPAELGFVDALVQLSFQVQAELSMAAHRHDLTVPQIRLMGILRDREPGMLELAGHLGLDKSSVTGLIDRAERRGLVQRAASATDGRAVHVVTTPLGRELTARVGAEVVAQILALGRNLSGAEQRKVAALIGRLVSE